MVRLFIALTRLDKPVGIYLLLWPTLLGFLLAVQIGLNQQLDLHHAPLVLLVFVAGVVLMRSAGCAINDWADREFDGQVERTHKRVLVSGQMRPKYALMIASVLALVAFVLLIGLCVVLQRWHVLTWSIPAVLLAASYPFMKRFFVMPQLYLGLAFGFGIPMVCVALIGIVPWQAWLLLIANLCWTVAYDTQYALVDKPDDLKIGIHTSAISFERWFGRFDGVAIAVCHALALLLWAAVGWLMELGWAYWVALCLACVLAYQQLNLIRYRRGADCFRAFLWAHWQGAVLCLGWIIDLSGAVL
jgi:4-hydroxybenzoate polyprenyltransferase